MATGTDHQLIPIRASGFTALAPLEIPGVAVTNIGVVFEEGRTYVYQDFAYLVEFARSLRNSGTWALADALLKAQEQLGEDFAQLVTELDYEPSYLANLMSVARAIPINWRRDKSPSFYMIVAPLARGGTESSLRLADAWVQACIDNDWDRAAFKKELGKYLLPPQMRDEISWEEISGPVYDEEFKPIEVRPSFRVADLINAADSLAIEAERHNLPAERVRPVRQIVNYYRLGGAL